MKVAIVHDELIRKGGAEQVTIAIHKAFPNTPIYTSAYNEQNTYEYFSKCDIRTSWLNKFVQNEKLLKLFFFPFGVFAMMQLDLRKYDVVLLSSTHCSKYVKVRKGAKVINYCHNPFRMAWFPESYNSYRNASFLKKNIMNIIIFFLRKVDFHHSKKVTHYLTNAEQVKSRIKEKYQTTKDIVVINPAANINKFRYNGNKQNYYLVVSRIEDYKKVDLVVKVFNKLSEKLIIVGTGSMMKEVKNLVEKGNIEFKENVDSATLSDLYSNAKALIFPQHEDYGITPIEANASGTPVIAYGKGGVLETMINYKDSPETASALFFEEQSIESLTKAIELFKTISFNHRIIRKNAERFDEDIFIEEYKEHVNNFINS